MIRIYGMPSCPDCAYLENQLTDAFTFIDIGSDVHLLKEFIHLRDTEDIFLPCKENGTLGIPCFVQEDGKITLTPEDVGLRSRPADN